MRREFFATTQEEAVEKASNKLGIPKDALQVEALQGSFGGPFTEKKVGIIVQFEETSAEKKEDFLQSEVDRLRSDPNALSRFVLKTILDQLSLDANLEILEKEDQVILTVSFEGEAPDTRRGDIRELRGALQYLLNRIMSNGSDPGKRYIIDFGGDLQHRTQTMESLAEYLGSKVKGLEKTMHIKLMDAQDRRLLHLALLENQHVSSFSQGEGRFRVLCLKKKEQE